MSPVRCGPEVSAVFQDQKNCVAPYGFCAAATTRVASKMRKMPTPTPTLTTNEGQAKRKPKTKNCFKTAKKSDFFGNRF